MTCSTEGSPEQRKSGEAGIYLVKRDGRQEALNFAKIMSWLKKLSYGLSQEHGDPVLIRMSAPA
jgi:ribonucleoside-diphosphate reductase subunit M1